MLYITNSAKQHFLNLLSKQKKGTNIRVFVINPGKNNAECGVSYCSIDSLKSNDIELKFGLFSVYIDDISYPYLQNAEIDLIQDKLGSQLTLKAPNAKGEKISNDADAPIFERVNYFLQYKINPKLEEHGGRISLIEITHDMIVIIQFEGGCNGCSMVNFTLKNGIEKELMENFPNLRGVRDLTDHKIGEHSYY